MNFTRRGILGLFAGAAAAAALPKQPEPAPAPPPAPEPAPLYDFKTCGAYNPKHDCECYRNPGHTGTHGCYVAERQPDRIDWSFDGSLGRASGPTITYIEWPRGMFPKDIDGVFPC